MTSLATRSALVSHDTTDECVGLSRTSMATTIRGGSIPKPRTGERARYESSLSWGAASVAVAAAVSKADILVTRRERTALAVAQYSAKAATPTRTRLQPGRVVERIGCSLPRQVGSVSWQGCWHDHAEGALSATEWLNRGLAATLRGDRPRPTVG